MIERYADQQRAAAAAEELEDLVDMLDRFGFWWRAARRKAAQRIRSAEFRQRISDALTRKASHVKG